MLLSELSASARRLALVGLAKNTGKTVALAALLRELEAAGRTVGVTSVGRDGEEHDVIDFRIEKPSVKLCAGSFVATTDGLLRASGVPHELLERTGVRTPLGEVLIARMKGPGAIEVAGPSASQEVRAVSDAMLSFGAEQVLIDGAVDRRAASSPEVADALLMSTGAVLSEDLDEVVSRTKQAVELVRLETMPTDTTAGIKLREMAGRQEQGESLLVEEALAAHSLPARFALTAEASDIDAAFRAMSAPRWLLISGALPEAFLRGLASFARRTGKTLTLVVSDPTRVFVSERGVAYYRHHGIQIQTLRPIDLRGLTVNPVAPQSHSFASTRLRSRLSEAIPGLPVFDVMGPEYRNA